MSNKSYFFNNKLSYNLKSYKSYKFIIFLLLLILVAIIFVDYNSLFNNFEGYCKFGGGAKLVKDSEEQAKRQKTEHEKKTGDLNKNKSLLDETDNMSVDI